MHDQTTVAVLAGGLGSRIGGGKPLRELAGRPLISYPVVAGLTAGLPVTVVAKPSTELPLLPEGVELLLEPELPLHPLAGLVTALNHHDRVLVVACDMPLLTPSLLAWLSLQPAPAVIRDDEGGVHPIPSLHRSEDRSRLQDALRDGAPLRASFQSLSPTWIDFSRIAAFGDPQRMLMSVNTPALMLQAQSWIS